MRPSNLSRWPEATDPDERVEVPPPHYEIISRALHGDRRGWWIAALADGQMVHKADPEARSEEAERPLETAHRQFPKLIEELRENGVMIGAVRLRTDTPMGYTYRWRYHQAASSALASQQPSAFLDTYWGADPVVREAIAHNPHTDLRTRMKLVDDPEVDVRAAVASSAHSPEVVLDRLASRPRRDEDGFFDPDQPRVDTALLDNPRTTVAQILTVYRRGIDDDWWLPTEEVVAGALSRRDDLASLVAGQIIKSHLSGELAGLWHEREIETPEQARQRRAAVIDTILTVLPDSERNALAESLGRRDLTTEPTAIEPPTPSL